MALKAIAAGVCPLKVRVKVPAVPATLKRWISAIGVCVTVTEPPTPPIASNAHLPLLFGSNLRINVGFLIALACALGYRDFRFEGSWRPDHPALVAWLEEFEAKVPSFAATRPSE